MRRSVLLLILLVLSTSIAASEWVPLTSSTPRPPTVAVLSDVPGETVFRVDLPGYFLEEVSVGGIPHARILLPKSPRLLVAGEPELPFVAVSVAIPHEGTPVAEVLEADSRTVVLDRYIPSKGSLSRAVDPASVPFTFSPTYGRDAAFPGVGCESGAPYLLRNVRGAAVSVYPIRYNPVRGVLSVSPSVTVRVRTSGVGGANVLTAGVPECRDFQQIYAGHFANGASGSWAYTPVQEAGGLLVITGDAFYDALLPLAYWKRQKGVPTEIVKLSTVGTTSAQVKSFIQARYSSGSLAYVLLVGDSAYMPYPTGTAGNVVGNAADPMYALVSGTDSYPDIVVSRFPAQTATEASTMANRVIRYEKTPQAGASWYGSATGIASNEGSPTDGQRMDWLRTDLLAYGYDLVDRLYDPGASASQVAAALNSGRGLVNYIGHGGDTYWVTSGFGVSDVYALNNADMVPFIFDVACVNGKFNRSGGDCFAEAWLKAGTPAAPKGALGIYASSTNQDWVPPCDAQGESVDLLVADLYHTFGALCFNGVMKGLDMYPGVEGQQLFQQWHIFGDGSQVVSTDAPAPMGVTHANGIGGGAMSFDVSVPGVQGALCALYDEASHSLFGSAYTAGGTASILLNAPPTGVSSLTLTVTAFNRTPYIATVQVGGNYLQAAASATPESGVWPLPVSFVASATGGTPPYTYQWTFGDGSTSATQNPTHTYTAAGTFPVVLTVWDSAGATVKDPHISVSVSTPPCTLTCSASAPAAGEAGVAVEFGASSSGSAGCTGYATYSWNFGDGETAAQKNPRHAYGAAGTYTWTLTVSMAGQACSKTGTLAVAPGCELTCQGSASPSTGEAPLTVAFSASASATDCSGAPVFAWSFGDGFSSAQQNPNHTYAAAGTYPWELTVTADGRACSRSGSVTVVQPCEVTCEASALPASGDAPLAVSFSAAATAPYCGDQLSFAWSFGDGGTDSTQAPDHTYTSAGIYSWTLTVIADGQTCSKTGTVDATEPCVLSCAASSAPTAGDAPLEVAFTGAVTASGCDGGTNFAWAFGDGSTSALQSPTHTYAAPGTYSWEFTATLDGKACTQVGTVTVSAPCVLGCESAVPATGKAGQPADFSATASVSDCPSAPTYAWDFGDGALSSETDPTHAYTAAGAYTWILTITSGDKTCGRTGVITVSPSVPGDGDGDGAVSIGEVQQAVNMFLGNIPAGNGTDCDGDGAVSVGELQRVINGFLGVASPCP